MTALPKDKLQEALDCYYFHGQNQRAAAVELKIPRSTMQNRIMRAEEAGLKPSPHAANTGDPFIKMEHELRKLADDNRDLRAQINSVHRDNLSAAKVREFISGIGDVLPEPPKWVINPGTVGDPGIPVAIWSDWHVGEVVSMEQVGGANEYNMEIAQARVKTLVEKIILLCFKHTVNPDYPGIVVCLGGDMISGIIHQELVEGQEGAMTAQIKETYALLAWALGKMADAFGNVFVPCVVGNHGRMHHKPRAKNRAQDSFEYLIYHFLDAHFRDDDRIKFFVAEQTDARFNVGNHRFLLTHGDSTGAKGGDSFIGAIGPIVRGEKKVREVSGFTDGGYDTALMGHYHQFVALDGVIVNSSLKGYDEYARNVLRCRPERPNQTLLFVHPDFGIIDTRRIWLEKKPVKATGEWVSWSKR